jgi:hypothetical protein
MKYIYSSQYIYMCQYVSKSFHLSFGLHDTRAGARVIFMYFIIIFNNFYGKEIFSKIRKFWTVGRKLCFLKMEAVREGSGT